MRMEWTNFGFDPSGLMPDAALTWLPGREDFVELTVSRGACAPENVEIGLTSQADGDPVRWWKGLRVLSREGNQLGVSETQDNNHSGGIMLFPASSLPGMKLELWKAKLFGIHTGMYDLPLDPLERWGGTRFIFNWVRDNGNESNAR
jgi:hypothetical protein